MLVWIAFIALICCFLALDLGVFHRKAHVVTAREGLTWSVVWMTLAIAFGGFVYGAYEHHWLGLAARLTNWRRRRVAFSDAELIRKDYEWQSVRLNS